MFDSFFILADECIPVACRSNVLAMNKICWVQVFGIPLHLRSVETIRMIGSLCGSYLEADVNNWFNDGIRIKILVKEKIPDEVLLRF
ncbi:hypothetical protein LINGRAHAP2_LOCUS24646 [Linum grandiflorum]